MLLSGLTLEELLLGMAAAVAGVAGTVLFRIERPPPLGEGELIEAGILWPPEKSNF